MKEAIELNGRGKLDKSAGYDNWPGKLLAFIKVCIYILFSFASTSWLAPAVLQLYQQVQDKALFYFLVSAFDCLLALALLYLFGTLIDKKPLASFGLTGFLRIDPSSQAGVFADDIASGGTGHFIFLRPFLKSGLTQVMAGVVVAFVMVSTVMLILYLSGNYHIYAAAFNVQFFTYLPFFIVAALREEVMFRGYVLQTLERHWGTTGAVIISALLFGFLHMINFESGISFFAKIYSCLCLSLDAGLVFAFAYLLTRRLWFPFGIHVAWNIFEGPVYGTLVSSLTLGEPILKAQLTGSDYLTGGVFGPEASLIEVLVCLLLVALMRQVMVKSE